MKKNILVLLTVALSCVACENQFEPANDNHQTDKLIYHDPSRAEGLLMNAYRCIPNLDGFTYSDVATDDAVSNDKSNKYLKMATGSWTSQNDPMTRWSYYTGILYVNKLLDEIDDINWAPLSGEAMSSLHRGRNKGECYGMRALLYFYLLQAHAGVDDAGNLMGVPLLLLSPDADGFNYTLPRNTYAECLTQINKDLDEAEKYLPLDYGTFNSVSEIPAYYQQLGSTLADFNYAFGISYTGRLSGRLVKAIRAQVATMSASAAYQAETWANAAKYNAEVLNLIGGIAGLDPKGNVYYSTASNIENLDQYTGVDQPEMLWRGNVSTTSTLEENNFPPTFFGKGRINPTQNLVDAFPMANGYPITDALSGYDPANPYDGRDPRLELYILHNGSAFQGKTLNTAADGGNNDAIDAIATSTRTGYYMRKLIREDAIFTSTTTNSKRHYNVNMRYTDFFLLYAEAANEAYGPDGKAANATYSAREVVAAIRQRAGIAQPDAYLASISSKEDMRTLIRNERRLELCFEGYRFYDLRRWKADLTETAKGMRIEGGVYNVVTVESRSYKDYMYYGPIPYAEALKYNYDQNKGW